MHASFEKPVPTNKEGKVCMHRSKNPCRQAKLCIPQSLRCQTNNGKCACLVLKACADKRNCVYLRACADKQTRESVYALFLEPVPSSESVYTSKPALTNKEEKVCMLVLKACVNEQTGEVCITRCKSFLRAGATKKWMS